MDWGLVFGVANVGSLKGPDHPRTRNCFCMVVVVIRYVTPEWLGAGRTVNINTWYPQFLPIVMEFISKFQFEIVQSNYFILSNT